MIYLWISVCVTNYTITACDPLVRLPTQIFLHVVCGCACHSFRLSFFLALSLSPTKKNDTQHSAQRRYDEPAPCILLSLHLDWCCFCHFVSNSLVALLEALFQVLESVLDLRFRLPKFVYTSTLPKLVYTSPLHIGPHLRGNPVRHPYPPFAMLPICPCCLASLFHTSWHVWSRSLSF